MSDLPATLGLRHVALRIPDGRYDATARFYREGMGMAVDWQPDADALYLSCGPDNLALHRATEDLAAGASSPLDHLGFAMPSADVVRDWYARLSARAEDLQIELITPVEHHRDGATSFYLKDPAGNVVQLLHLPNLQP